MGIHANTYTLLGWACDSEDIAAFLKSLGQVTCRDDPDNPCQCGTEYPCWKAVADLLPQGLSMRGGCPYCEAESSECTYVLALIHVDGCVGITVDKLSEAMRNTDLIMAAKRILLRIEEAGWKARKAKHAELVASNSSEASSYDPGEPPKLADIGDPYVLAYVDIG